jgi:hypothetical protein
MKVVFDLQRSITDLLTACQVGTASRHPAATWRRLRHRALIQFGLRGKSLWKDTDEIGDERCQQRGGDLDVAASSLVRFCACLIT